MCCWGNESVVVVVVNWSLVHLITQSVTLRRQSTQTGRRGPLKCSRSVCPASPPTSRNAAVRTLYDWRVSTSSVRQAEIWNSQKIRTEKMAELRSVCCCNAKTFIPAAWYCRDVSRLPVCRAVPLDLLLFIAAAAGLQGCFSRTKLALYVLRAFCSLFDVGSRVCIARQLCLSSSASSTDDRCTRCNLLLSFPGTSRLVRLRSYWQLCNSTSILSMESNQNVESKTRNMKSIIVDSQENH